MSKLYFVRGVAAVICAVASITANAQEREPVTAGVKYGDLNLATAAGQTAFKTRVHRVASRACDTGEIGAEMVSDRLRCVHEMERDGDTRLAALISTPSVQLASAASAK